MEPATLALITAGIAAASGAGQAGATSKLNRKTREWNEKMYFQQKADNLEKWDLQNYYNSPQQMMARYKEAGLNPALMYGQATSGQAGSIDSAKPQNWNPQTPDTGAIGQAAMQGLGAYNDTRMHNAQLSMMDKQKALLELEENYKLLRNSKLIVDTKLGNQLYGKRDIENSYLDSIMKSSLEMNAHKIEQLKADTKFRLNEDERQAVNTASNLMEALERVLLIRAQTAHTQQDRQRIKASIENLKADTNLKKQSYDMQAKGIMPNDTMVSRLIGNLVPLDAVSEIKTQIQKGYHSFKNWISN